jgi:HAD superfamily hydrolase (TIGR01509 family)
MKAPLRALVFDVDGTLADTENFHRQAFNQAFAAEGLDWEWDEALYTRLLDISGGQQRILNYWNQTRGSVIDIDGSAVRDIVGRIHMVKCAFYEAMVRDGRVPLRPGVLALLEDARRQGLQLAIATTTSPGSVAALLHRGLGANWRSVFAVVCDASTARLMKPHPQVYRQALQRLGLDARSCIAFEDSANGLRSATAAGMATVITPTRFTADHDFTGALRVLDHLAGVGVHDLQSWRQARHEREGALS